MGWETTLNTVIGALVGSGIASWMVAGQTQKWIEHRERRNRRDELQLELYAETIDLVLQDEAAIASSSAAGSIPDTKIQQQRIRISHRLKLLASSEVLSAFDTYKRLVFQETSHPIGSRPQSPNDVVEARDALIAAMAKDV